MPAESLLGVEGRGFQQLAAGLQRERIMAAVLALSGAAQALEDSASYLRERQAFGAPLAQKQVLRHRMADMATEIEAARQLVYRAASLYQAGEECVAVVSMAKLFATEAANRVAYQSRADARRLRVHARAPRRALLSRRAPVAHRLGHVGDDARDHRAPAPVVILHVNHTAPHGRLAAPASELVGALLALVEDGSVDTGLLPALRVHLDWIQYRANFREPVSVRRATDAAGAPVALAEIAVDLRQAEPGRFREELARALAALGPDAADDDDRVWVDDWAPMRESIIWRFNRLFWQRLGEWERATGRGFEDALPSGKSDANHPQAVADAVADFWTLLRDLDKHGHLPAEIFALEIGVGSGTRAALWLDRFKALDEERGTGYYPRLRFLLGDYSLPTLDRALDGRRPPRRRRERPRARRAEPLPHAVVPPLQDPLRAPDQRLRQPARSTSWCGATGELYLVEMRAYLQPDAAGRIAADFGVPAADLPRLVSPPARGRPRR